MKQKAKRFFSSFYWTYLYSPDVFLVRSDGNLNPYDGSSPFEPDDDALEVVGVALRHHLESLPLPYRIFYIFCTNFFCCFAILIIFFLGKALHFQYMQGRWCQENSSIDFILLKKNSLIYRFFFLNFFFFSHSKSFKHKKSIGHRCGLWCTFFKYLFFYRDIFYY